MGGVRRLALLVVVPLALTACGSSNESAPTTTAAPPPPPPPASTRPEPGTTQALHPASGKVDVTIDAPTHTPKVNAPWRYTVRVTSNGKPVSARIYIQVLFRGAAVGNIGTHL